MLRCVMVIVMNINIMIILNLNLNQNFSSKLERKLHYVLAIECTQQVSKKQPYLTMRAYIYMNTYTTLELINIPLGTWSAHDLIMLR